MTNRSKVIAYLQLLRFPNVFTAFADVVMGFLFVSASLVPLGGLVALLLSSACLYLAGMVLNDLFDYEVDKKGRPFRPLPSGRISLSTATFMGFGLLGAGILFGALGGVFFSLNTATWRAATVAAALASFVILYDGVLKQTVLGGLAMGSCRTLNVLLGMSLFPAVGTGSYLSFSVAQWCVAGGIGLYISGVTWFARSEAKESSRMQLAAGAIVMFGGIVLLAIFPRYGVSVQFANPVVWPFLLLLVMISVIRRCLVAIVDPRPETVQKAVKLCIFSLIVLDASVCLAVRGPYYSVGVLALLIPAALLGRVVYST